MTKVEGPKLELDAAKGCVVVDNLKLMKIKEKKMS